MTVKLIFKQLWMWHYEVLLYDCIFFNNKVIFSYLALLCFVLTPNPVEGVIFLPDKYRKTERNISQQLESMFWVYHFLNLEVIWTLESKSKTKDPITMETECQRPIPLLRVPSRSPKVTFFEPRTLWVSLEVDLIESALGPHKGKAHKCPTLLFSHYQWPICICFGLESHIRSGGRRKTKNKLEEAPWIGSYRSLCMDQGIFNWAVEKGEWFKNRKGYF